MEAKHPQQKSINYLFLLVLSFLKILDEALFSFCFVLSRFHLAELFVLDHLEILALVARRALPTLILLEVNILHQKPEDYTVCPKKGLSTYFQMAVTHFRIVKITKVGGVLVRAGADLSNAYNYFSVTQLGNYFLTHGILGQPSLPIGSIPRGRDH